MFSRTSRKARASLLSVAVLAVGCSQNNDQLRGTEIECALDGSPHYRSVCMFELNGNAAILRRPDGGFHRLVRDGAIWRSLDGADELKHDAGDSIAIGYDRYRLPSAGAR